MLTYSDRALWARRRFFAPYNDVTIVVEDQGKENFYTKIFERLLRGNLQIKSVIGVGGKRQVLERFHAQRPAQTQPEFFLVDGDFDEILGLPYPSGSNFYRLNRYDIESFLIEETAICLIAEEQCPAVTSDRHSAALKIEMWLSEAIRISVRLAAAAALWQELGIREARLSQAIERHSQNVDAIPDRGRISSFIDERKKHQVIVKPVQFDILLDRMVARMGMSDREWQRWISGKHILLPLLAKLLNTHTGSQFKKDSLCFRLASKCEFPELQDLRNRILAVPR